MNSKTNNVMKVTILCLTMLSTANSKHTNTNRKWQNRKVYNCTIVNYDIFSISYVQPRYKVQRVSAVHTLLLISVACVFLSLCPLFSFPFWRRLSVFCVCKLQTALLFLNSRAIINQKFQKACECVCAVIVYEKRSFLKFSLGHIYSEYSHEKAFPVLYGELRAWSPVNLA